MSDFMADHIERLLTEIRTLRDLLKTTWEQAGQGVSAEHDCPAVFACSAILAELSTAGYCGNCFGEKDACERIWVEQRKCCPDCTHVPPAPPEPIEHCTLMEFCTLRKGHEGFCDDIPF